MTAVVIALVYMCTSCGGGKMPGTDPVERNVSIAYLKSLYNGHPRLITEDYIITGHVTSSDQFGNFYKVLLVEDGTAGIEVKIDMKDLFKTYNIGTEVYVYCNSLTLGAYGKLVQLGTAPHDEYETGYIDGADIGKYIAGKNTSPVEIRPLELGVAELTPQHISRFVVFSGVWFEEADRGVKWTESGTDTDRILTDAAGNTIAVRTSAHALFAERELPEGTIEIEGILSWFGDDYQLRIIRP